MIMQESSQLKKYSPTHNLCLSISGKHAGSVPYAKQCLTKSLGGLEPSVVELGDAEGSSEPASKITRVGVAHVGHTCA